MPISSEQYFNSLTPQQQEAARASGAAPGGPNHAAWFANAQQAGAVGAVNNPGGGGVGTPQGESGGGNQAGRVTAADVRANAQKYGLPEDYARFSDAELNDWIRRWDYNPSTGKFTNKFGDQVDKPDERGPNTPQNMNGTGDRGNFGAGGGGGQGGQGQGQGQGQGFGQGNALFDPSDPLQNALVDRFRTQGGFVGEQGVTGAQALQGGGVFSQAAQQPVQQPVSTPQNNVPNIVNPQRPAQNQGFSGIQQSISQAFTPLGSSQETSAGPAPVANPVAKQQSPLQTALFNKFRDGTGVNARLPASIGF